MGVDIIGRGIAAQARSLAQQNAAAATIPHLSAAPTTEVASTVTVVQVNGFAEAGHGGGARYRRAPAQPAHAARFRTLDRFLPDGTMDSGAGGWWELDETVVDVRMFGASTARPDNQTAINAAIVYLNTIGGGVAEVPNGFFETEGAVELLSKVTLRGSSGGLPGQGSATNLGRMTYGTVVNFASGVCQAQLEKMTINAFWDGSANSSRGVVIAPNCIGNRIQQVHVFGTNDEGIWVQGIANYIIDCAISGACWNRSPQSYLGALRLGGSDHIVRGCEVGCSMTRLPSSNTGGTPNRYCAGIYLEGSTCFVSDSVSQFSDVGLRLGNDAWGNRINCLRIDASAYQGIHNCGYRNQFANLSFALGSSLQSGFSVPLIDNDGTAILPGNPSGNHMGGNTFAEVVFNLFGEGRHSFTVQDTQTTSSAAAFGPNTYGLISDSFAINGHYNVTNPAAGALFAPASPGMSLPDNDMNGLPNSALSGAVAGVIGSGGIFPAGMGVLAGFSGLTQSIVEAGVEDGLEYVAVRFSGTAAASFGVLAFENFNSNCPPCNAAETWTGSAFVKLSGPALPPGGLSGLALYEADASGSNINIMTSRPIPSSVTLTPLRESRISVTRTLSDPNVGRAALCMLILLTDGADYDFTLRLAGPQLEKGPAMGVYHRTQGKALLPYYTTEYVTPASGGTIIASNQRIGLYLDSESLDSLNVTLPKSAYDGQRWAIYSKSAVTGVALTAGAGQSFNAPPPTGLSPGSSLKFEFRAATRTWYRE